MPTVQELSRLLCFRKASNQALQRIAPLWVDVHVDVGAPFWKVGDPAAELGIVIEGELAVDVGGETVARLRPGDLVGESGIYGGGRRAATVYATQRTRLILISSSDLARIRAGLVDVYSGVVEQALFQVVQRVRRTGELITARAPGDMQAPARKELAGLARMWRALVPGGPSTPCPPLAPLLRRVRGLAHAPPEAILALTTCFRPVPMSEGELIFLQAEPGNWAFILAEGGVEVVRHVHGGKAEHLDRIEPGAMVGINALIDAGPRTASCVASSAGWLYRIDLEHLRNPPAAAAVWWKEAMLFNLAHQLRMADESLARLKGMPMELGREDLETLDTAEVDPLSEELEELHTAEIEMLTAEVLEAVDQAEEFLPPPDLAPESPQDADTAADEGEHALTEQPPAPPAAAEDDEPLFYPTGTDEVVGTGETTCPPAEDLLAEPELPPE
ncbi:MAG TPA: cyclic nucleotide-binding domain-containing protein [Myxococcota bacterium]|nr:cyclic nucleotide-binding domain-containing protein [Myxococcota bacterium]